jgi:hypothetical protein
LHRSGCSRPFTGIPPAQFVRDGLTFKEIGAQL